MPSLKVNTDAVVRAAGNIQNYNRRIRDGFPAVQTAVTELGRCWDGAVADAAISKFGAIRSKFCDARYSVLDDYANFLLQQIGEGYVQTEEKNVSLADRFK